MSRSKPSPNLLRGLCFAFLIAGALSLACALALPLIMAEIRDLPPALIEDTPQAIIIDADVRPLATEERPALLICPICGSPCTPMKINLICDHGHKVEHAADGGAKQKVESRKLKSEIGNLK